jgi:hypothetical protein
MMDFLIQVASGLVVLFIGWLAASLWNNRAKGPSIAPQFAVDAVLSEDAKAAKSQDSGGNKRIAILSIAVIALVAVFAILNRILGIAYSPSLMVLSVIGGLIAIVVVIRKAMK